jgi:para-nitrobenzyl esterase
MANYFEGNSGSRKLTAAVDTQCGPVQGIDCGDLHVYLGIPFAAPPIGNLRWMPPQQPTSWAAPFQATAYGNNSQQNADLGAFAEAGGSEDCLYLNVFANHAASASGKKLPVFIWIHGGSLWVGSGKDYDGSKLALKGEAIVVTINYRLGLMGFFAHPEINSEGHPFANYGLMDQAFAMDWVQRNIAAFGGDPDNVTISGESSGGQSTMAHLISPGSAGKFHHAVTMSGCALIMNFGQFGAVAPLETAEKLALDFAKATGCANAADLRALPAETVLAKQTPYLWNQPIIDGQIVPMHPGEAMRSGKINKCTLVNGCTLEEGLFFTGWQEDFTGEVMTEEGYLEGMKGYFGDLADEVMKEYPRENYVTPSEAYAAPVGDHLFTAPGDAANRMLCDKIPVYAYEFADRTAPSYLKPCAYPMGAAHTAELAYIFPGYHGAGIPTELNEMQDKLSDVMIKYWSSVAKAEEWGEAWPCYTAEKGNYMRFALPEAHMTENVIRKVHKLDFWDQAGIY